MLEKKRDIKMIFERSCTDFLKLYRIWFLDIQAKSLLYRFQKFSEEEENNFVVYIVLDNKDLVYIPQQLNQIMLFGKLNFTFLCDNISVNKNIIPTLSLNYER